MTTVDIEQRERDETVTIRAKISGAVPMSLGRFARPTAKPFQPEHLWLKWSHADGEEWLLDDVTVGGPQINSNAKLSTTIRKTRRFSVYDRRDWPEWLRTFVESTAPVGAMTS
jgi:hypothetical protein